MLSLVLIAAEAGAMGLLVGFALAVLPVPVYVGFALWLDRFEAEPAHLLIRAFAWGAVVAFPVSLLLNTLAELLTSSELAGAIVAAPLTEEIGKGFVLLLLFVQQPDEFDNVTDGVVYALMVGLGFAMTENVLIYGLALADGSTTSTFVLRGVIAPFAHPLFTAMIGIGLGVARETTRREIRPLAVIGGLAAAVALHALWNLSARFDLWFGVVYLGVMAPAFAAVLITVRRSLLRESEIIHRFLAPLVASGELPEDELRVLCTIRARLRKSWRALASHGSERWLQRRELHQAASELAFHRWRVSRGISAGPRRDAARDAEYRARLRELVRRCAAP
jgi:RsiW-degrading membrane proteinase PrsW (M82 family)